jgi:hypothetical protein
MSEGLTSALATAGVTAVLTALLTLSVQLFLERTKQTSALATEITRAHIEAIKRVFAAAYEYRGAIGDVESDIIHPEASVGGEMEKAEKLLGELKKTVAQERFALGKRFFEKAQEYTWASEATLGELREREVLGNHSKRMDYLLEGLHALAPDLDLLPSRLLTRLKLKR